MSKRKSSSSKKPSLSAQFKKISASEVAEPQTKKPKHSHGEIAEATVHAQQPRAPDASTPVNFTSALEKADSRTLSVGLSSSSYLRLQTL